MLLAIKVSYLVHPLLWFWSHQCLHARCQGVTFFKTALHILGRMIKKFQSTLQGSVSSADPCSPWLSPTQHLVYQTAKLFQASGSHLACDIAQNERQEKVPSSPQATRTPEACVPPKPLGPQKLMFLLSHMDPWEILKFKGWPITGKILTEPTWSSLASSPG